MQPATKQGGASEANSPSQTATRQDSAAPLARNSPGIDEEKYGVNTGRALDAGGRSPERSPDRSPAEDGKKLTPRGEEALKRLRTVNIKEKAEYSGGIYKREDGTYTTNPPQRGGEETTGEVKIPTKYSGGVLDGWYHSHGRWSGPSDELLSPDDVGFSNRNRIDGYMMDGHGGYWYYKAGSQDDSGPAKGLKLPTPDLK